ncbi:MAG: hypothetical protein RLZZ424_1351, partial [Bacteroidota bacterium]
QHAFQNQKLTLTEPYAIILLNNTSEGKAIIHFFTTEVFNDYLYQMNCH